MDVGESDEREESEPVERRTSREREMVRYLEGAEQLGDLFELHAVQLTPRLPGELDRVVRRTQAPTVARRAHDLVRVEVAGLGREDRQDAGPASTFLPVAP